MYGRSSWAFSDLVVRGLGTGGIGESNGVSGIVSAGDGLLCGGLEAIVCICLADGYSNVP